MAILCGKDERSDLGPFRPSFWDDTAGANNPRPEVTQNMYIKTALYTILSGTRLEHVRGSLSFGNKKDGLLWKRISSALLANCVVQRGAR